MNIKTSYFMYTAQFETHVLDVMTGKSYKVSFAYTTPATEAIISAFADVHGRVGYLADEYNVYRIEETGEEFVYPYSFGYANPDDVMQSEFAQKARAAQQPVPLPRYNGIPNPITQREAFRAYVENQKREVMMQRSPLARLAVDLTAAIGQPEREGRFWLAIEIVRDAQWSHPQDKQARDCYNELRDALSNTNAPLSDVREFMSRAADGFGY